MAESTIGVTRNVSIHHQRTSVSRGVDTTVTSKAGAEFSTPQSEVSQMTFDEETLVSTVQLPQAPEPSVSETAASDSPLSPLEASLETPFGSFNVFESAAYGDSEAYPRGVPQEKAKFKPDDGPVTSLRLPLQQSLGILSCVTIFGGSVLTLVAVGFLIFLWAGGGPVKGGTEAQPAWRAIMLHGWATQSVTLTSLLIRFISGAQAGLCTSMVAALLLERRGVPISKVVQLSVTRSVKADPMEFLYAITSQITRKTALRLEILLLFTLALTALGIQFSSTILISDFGTTHLVQHVNRTTVNVALSPKGANSGGSFVTLGNLDSSTVLFGEVDSQVDSAPNQLGVSDIGTKRRAFLPFQKEERIDLQYFSGAAFSLVSRATCIRPSMIARLIFTSEHLLSISGTINYNHSLANARQSPTQRCYTSVSGDSFCLPETFNCTLPVSTETAPNVQWPTAICHLPINLDSDSHTMPAWDQHSSPFDFTSGLWAHLVFATNFRKSYLHQIEQSGPVTLGKPTSYGEWVSNEVELGKFLNTTFCFSGLNTTVSSITMTGNINQTEPNLAWNTTTDSLQINPLQILFDADDMHKTPSQRGIFTITGNIQDPAPFSAFNVNATSANNAISVSSNTFGNGAAIGVWENDAYEGTSVGMCNHCSIFGGGVSDDIAALFQYIINTTGRSALAIDTYLTMLSRSWYYSLLSKFDVPGYVSTAFVVEVLLPLRWSGLTAVIVLVGINTVLVWTISVLYIRRTRFTLAGNYWHAVAQLISKETSSLLEKSGEMKDQDVTEKLDLESEDFLVKIERSAQDGLITVVKV
ncbi:hypothetical protein F4801DRAFT_562622 [Xylaria longipes]|nr:hypothetical protein F4801DRAFT_562622 [Xylaria longipes]